MMSSLGVGARRNPDDSDEDDWWHGRQRVGKSSSRAVAFCRLPVLKNLLIMLLINISFWWTFCIFWKGKYVLPTAFTTHLYSNLFICIMFFLLFSESSYFICLIVNILDSKTSVSCMYTCYVSKLYYPYYVYIFYMYNVHERFCTFKSTIYLSYEFLTYLFKQ